MEYWQKDIETMNREDLKKLQFERLRKTIEAAGNSPFYSKVFKENGITADSIQSLDDLQKIPFTTKDDLRNNYPYGMAAIPIKTVSVSIRRAARQVTQQSYCIRPKTWTNGLTRWHAVCIW